MLSNTFSWSSSGWYCKTVSRPVEMNYRGNYFALQQINSCFHPKLKTFFKSHTKQQYTYPRNPVISDIYCLNVPLNCFYTALHTRCSMHSSASLTQRAHSTLGSDPKSGTTSVQNAASLCSSHHTLVHEGGYTLQRVDEDDQRLHEQFVRQQHNGPTICRSGRRQRSPDFKAAKITCSRHDQGFDRIDADFIRTSGFNAWVAAHDCISAY